MSVTQPAAARRPPAARASAGSTAPAQLAADLRVALMRSARRLRAEKPAADLSDSQYSVLAVLHRLGPMAPGELAEFERVQPPSMTRTVASLERAGLLSRSAHDRDRRQVVLTLTDAGLGVVEETRRRRTAWLARRLAELDPQERAVLAAAGEILKRIADS